LIDAIILLRTAIRMCGAKTASCDVGVEDMRQIRNGAWRNAFFLLLSVVVVAFTQRRRSDVKRVFCAIVLLPLLAFCGPAQAQWGARPELYFYRTAISLEDGSQVFGFEVFSPNDMATFPESKEMSGVVLMVHWSTLCPAADRCDYSIIDNRWNIGGCEARRWCWR
jgi:hypothetical protein